VTLLLTILSDFLFHNTTHPTANQNCDRQLLITMATNLNPLSKKTPATRAKQVCGICKTPGHDRRNCPEQGPTLATQVLQIPVDAQNRFIERVLQPPALQPTPQMAPRINWDECMYVLFDLETTGGSRTDDNIIKICSHGCQP